MSTELKPKVGDPRGRRYDTRTVRLVRQMYADGEGWGKREIQRYLAERGIMVSYNTLLRWLDDSFAERVRESNRAIEARRRQEGRVKRSQESSTPLLDRMRQLQAASLSANAIATVLGVDEGVELSPHQVRYALRVGKEPKAGRNGGEAT